MIHSKIEIGIAFLLTDRLLQKSIINVGDFSPLAFIDLYHKGLGYKKRETLHVNAYYKSRSIARLEFDVLDIHSDIEKMILHNCKLYELPKEIGFAKELKSLDCSFNFLTTLRDSIENCKNLEEINLRMNEFAAFPKQLLNMNRLKKIDLRHQRPEVSKFTAIELSETIRKALPGCEILV